MGTVGERDILRLSKGKPCDAERNDLWDSDSWTYAVAKIGN